MVAQFDLINENGRFPVGKRPFSLQQERFDLNVRAVALDAGYLSTVITHFLAEQQIFTVIGHRRYHPVKGLLPKWKYKYDPETDTYHCP